MFDQRFGTASNFRKESRTEAALFMFVVLDGVVQFVLSQHVECNVHRSDPAASLTKDLVGSTT